MLSIGARLCSIVLMDRPDICAFFVEIEDPRVERTRRHDLVEVIVMAVLGVICNADGWPDIAYAFTGCVGSRRRE